MINIAVFASGSGSNAENLVTYFRNHPKARVVLVVSNRKEAKVFDRMKRSGTPAIYVPGKDFINGNIIDLLNKYQIDFIVLAGFLMLIPESLINAFPRKIVNIHPALLPKFGGKGMYGMRVHEAVINAHEKETGITIHYVNERFDEGEIIAQFKTELQPDDTPEQIAEKIHNLEMKYFPEVIDGLISDLL